MEECRLLARTLHDVIARRIASSDHRPGEEDTVLTAELDEGVGLPLALVAEADGGYGLDPAGGVTALRALGSFTGLTPAIERVHANWLAAAVGLPAGATGVADRFGGMELSGTPGAWRIKGRAHAAWACDGTVLIPVGEHVVALPVESAAVTVARSLAGEPRVTLDFDADLPDALVVARPSALDDDGWAALGAALRCQLIAGAAAGILEMTITHVGDRKQFGRALGQFQAVQHALALMAGEVASATVAADAAAEGFGSVPDVPAIAAAKLRCGEAAGNVAAAAHQLHGAIGYSAEHALHRLTKGLWSWRDEWGNETYWARVLGASVLDASAGGLWPALAQVGAAR